MPNVTINADDFEFDTHGRVVFKNLDKATELSKILSSADSSNTNVGCQNNGCGNNISCDEAFIKKEDVSLPGMDGDDRLIISNNDFKSIMEKIKQGVIDNNVFIQNSD
ncbi:hypothetical protein RZR38_21995 [Citrobacter freundii]|uniref:hypothetical protein n=1 Tax=Citrobacter freundii complex TaxID=1344959 RepID=UPI0015AF04C6|nr:hypothetical protein [Citrobacter freundii]MBQ5147713.1 hypothetical protein [Citrobacter freundii]MDV1858428.1 hypothetical protein [Citrobacter freundii]MEB0419622.1 hypothetical protein [Citrobacter freundii]MEB0916445.1 hypothetical protein [Citrobacter freundii]MEB6428291.1 hypothetical protein [Citrobacter freundii]